MVEKCLLPFPLNLSLSLKGTSTVGLTSLCSKETYSCFSVAISSGLTSVHSCVSVRRPWTFRLASCHLPRWDAFSGQLPAFVAEQGSVRMAVSLTTGDPVTAPNAASLLYLDLTRWHLDSGFGWRASRVACNWFQDCSRVRGFEQ